MKQIVQVHTMLPGDIVGSGERVVAMFTGIRMPAGKINVTLEKNGNLRTAVWNKQTFLTVNRE